MAALGTSVISYTFTVSTTLVLIDVDTRLNIRKRKEHIVHRSLSTQNNINLGYLISQDTTPQTNFYASDRSISLVQNRIPATFDYVLITSNQFTLNIDKFLVTDIFTTATSTQPSEPLFYYHRLNYFNSDLANFSRYSLLSLSFVDSAFKTRLVTDYYTDAALGYVYNNLENTYNQADGSYDITYLKYTVKYVDPITSASTINVYHEVLSNNPIFSLATFDDIDEYGNLIAGHDVYLVQEYNSGQSFFVTLPAGIHYAYKELYNSRIKVKPPPALNTRVPWYVKITNGKFITSIPTGLSSSGNYKYYLPEFMSQTFNPYPLYKQHLKEQAIILGQNLIKVASNIVRDDTNTFPVDLLVEDSTRTVKYAYTNDTTKVGTLYNTTITYIAGILSIDERTGFLELSGTINETDTIYVSYYSQEEDFEFTNIDFNPVSNLNILDHRIVLYLTPESSSTGELDKALYYLEVNSVGKIEYASQATEGSSSLAPGTARLLTEDFYGDGSPKHTFYYDYPSTFSGLRATYGGTFSAFMDGFNFIDKYSVESILTPTVLTTASGLVGGLIGTNELLQNITQNPKFLILADIYVGEAIVPENADVLDCRIQGGGIKNREDSAALLDQPEVSWYWNLNSKLPYPETTAFMVEVPKSVLTDYDGKFTYDQIRPIVENHMQLGGYPVIRTYGIDPVLNSSATASGLIQFSWPSYGTDKHYNVYFSPHQTGEYEQHNTDPIPDSGSTNTYTIDDLAISTDYYVYVGAIDINNYEYFGPTYRIRTTST